MVDFVSLTGSGEGAQVIVSDTPPQDVSGTVVWIDDSYVSPAQKVYDSESSVWRTIVPGSNVPTSEVTFTSESTVDVSDIDSIVEVQITSQSGSGIISGDFGFSGNGGEGQKVIAELDLSYFSSLDVVITPGQEPREMYGLGSGYTGGDGVLLRSGSGDDLVGAGGGGGGASEIDGAHLHGGKGGAPNGGAGGTYYHNKAPSGGSFFANHPAVEEKSNSVKRGSSLTVDLYTGST